VSYSLTIREIEVLRLVIEGKTRAQIGAELFIEEGTINTHVSHIFRKLGISHDKRMRGVVQMFSNREQLIRRFGRLEFSITYIPTGLSHEIFGDNVPVPIRGARVRPAQRGNEVAAARSAGR
jgi:hypothetical protein